MITLRIFRQHISHLFGPGFRFIVFATVLLVLVEPCVTERADALNETANGDLQVMLNSSCINCVTDRLNNEPQGAGNILVHANLQGFASNRVHTGTGHIDAQALDNSNVLAQTPTSSRAPTPTPTYNPASIMMLTPALPVTGTEFYVAPNGRPDGDGSKERPWSLKTALSHPEVVEPGDTIWLRGGTYRGAFTSKLTGTEDAPITVRQFPGERAILDGRGFTGNTLTVNGSWTTYWGFEVTNSNLDRTRARPTGVDIFGEHTKFINLVVHDAGNCFGFWSTALGAEIYGNIIYNCGWQGPAPDRGHGHGIYTQNKTDTKIIRDNIIFNQFGWGIHAYTENGAINGFRFEGNVSFNNGSSMREGRNDNILVGGYQPAERITLLNNYTYHPHTSGINVRLYFAATNNMGLLARDNYFAGGDPVALVQEWRQVTMLGNTFYGTGSLIRLGLPRGVTTSAYAWNSNTYYQGSSNPFRFQAVDSNFSRWKRVTGFDESSRYVSTRPTETKIFLRPNFYDPKRTHIIIYNWSLQSHVDVDVRGILRVGATYEVRNAQNYNSAPVLTGTYNGKPLRLPMSGLVVARPVGKSSGPASTGPEFNVFVLIQR